MLKFARSRQVILNKTAKNFMKNIQKTWTGSDAICFTEWGSKFGI